MTSVVEIGLIMFGEKVKNFKQVNRQTDKQKKNHQNSSIFISFKLGELQKADVALCITAFVML